MVLAFILSFVILLAWSLLTPKKEQLPPEKEKSQKTSEKISNDLDKIPPGKTTIIPTGDKVKDNISQNVEEKEITIETPLYKVLFSNAGAMIKSVQLKEYFLTTKPNSPFIELSGLEGQRDGLFQISFNGQSQNENGREIYQVDHESIILSADSPPRDLTFSSMRSDGVAIDQTFRFYPNRYDIDLSIKLTNRSENHVEGEVKADLKNMPPKDKKSYYSFVGIALLLDDKLEEIKTKKLKEDIVLSGSIGWVAYENEYFITALIPNDGQTKGNFVGRLAQSDVLKASYLTPSISLNPSEEISSHFSLYMGPRDLDILKLSGKKIDLAINFGWTDIIAKPLHYALVFFHRYVKNWGLAIIILTVLIKGIFWPLTQKSYRSMKEMQKLQPLMAKIREKYKGDKQLMNKELMSLYKTYKVNPMGGCLPMVIQIPVFFALFRILGTSIELRHAPFLLWINDLSAPDRLFRLPFEIPYMSPPYGIPILTLLMGASMFIQQKMTPTPGDPAQAKVMMFLPLIFTVMFVNFPSGLVLYWITQNILSIGQQYRILKKSA